jgi:hypothetical protein
MAITKDILGVFPEQELCASSDIAYCLMFYDWEKPVGSAWLNFAMNTFAEFGQTIQQGTGNLDAQHSHGGYARVKKKISGFFDENRQNIGRDFDIRLRGPINFEADAFFPCEIELVLGITKLGYKSGILAVRETLAGSCESLIGRVGQSLFAKTGVAYAGAFEFPTMFGPSFYECSMGAIPHRMSSQINETYGHRIARFSQNRYKGFLTKDGYLREVYPINFLMDTHLEMPFKGASFHEFAQRVGKLEKAYGVQAIYRWDVPLENLDEVRQALEPSGLILSSTYPPMSKN